MHTRYLLALSIFLLAMLGFTTQAFAVAPANDQRIAAQALTVPQSVTQTTSEATVDDAEPGTSCDAGGVRGSVWYSLSGVNRRLALTLVAAGDLDAVVDVYVRDRSQTTLLDCSVTNSRGIGILAFRATAGKEYLIRVSQANKSVAGEFQLNLATAADPAKAPGDHLPSNGQSDTVNLARNPSDAWAVRMRSGVTYRINLASNSDEYCVKAFVYAKHEFEDTPVKRLTCTHGYTLFTPQAGAGGTYTILVQAATRTLETQKYHLEVAEAGVDDMAPGIFWPSKSVSGSLSGNGIDVADMYNWDLRRTAFVDIRLDAEEDFEAVLLTATGREMGCTCDGSISMRMQPGQYFVVVRAPEGGSGSYKLKRVERSVTKTSISFNGSAAATTVPGQSVSIRAVVSPASTGKVVITLERHDPVYGWQFQHKYKGSANGGSFSVSFVPSGVGRWRAKAEFAGSKTANPSNSHFVHLSVKRP